MADRGFERSENPQLAPAGRSAPHVKTQFAKRGFLKEPVGKGARKEAGN
ncbi:MAG: hypothetical protein HY394_04395 [Candidatus Diapherotrites archaeon]|nr:hypothetical protein [Candidatus Diapherotrites archaeon]